ncbi:MAG: polysaccharide pyruvyl transferase family protein [Pseudomonadota bacterium]
MTKVAILTFQRSTNYGAVLQSYALQRSIAALVGVDCEVIDLLRPVHTDYKYTKRNAPLKEYAINALKEPQISLQKRIKSSARLLLESLVYIRKRSRFHKFEQSHIRFSDRSFCCSDDLYAAKLDYDCFVTGSDQVWNPTYPYSPEPYFLTFVPQGIPRIAYAPSFGVSEVNKEVELLYGQWLNEIHYLSVRETQGAELIYKLTGRVAEVVLDPTLLLTMGEWKEIVKETKNKSPYIFCYALGDVPGLMDLCYHIQEVTGYTVYKIGNVNDMWDRRVKTVVDAGPQEFIGYIANAEIVITNSFHGTVLSLNMEKPFFSVASPILGANSRNSRLQSVLSLFSLSNRLYKYMDKFPVEKDIHIAYDEVHAKLQFEREKSLSYLRRSICPN